MKKAAIQKLAQLKKKFKKYGYFEIKHQYANKHLVKFWFTKVGEYADVVIDLDSNLVEVEREITTHIQDWTKAHFEDIIAIYPKECIKFVEKYRKRAFIKSLNTSKRKK